DAGASAEPEREATRVWEGGGFGPGPARETPLRSVRDQGAGGDWAGSDDAPVPALNGASRQHSAVPANGADPEMAGWASLRPRTHNMGGEDTNLEDYVAAGLSLADHLTEQLHVIVTDPAERLIGATLIHALDEAGYLRLDLDDLADKLGAPAGLIAKVLGVLQGFDPPGVFARDLAECLALQLKDQNRYDPQIAKLLDNLA